jgi:hypothetical protein
MRMARLAASLAAVCLVVSLSPARGSTAEQNRLYTHIRELSSQIMKAGQDAPAAAWLRVACPDLMDTIQKLEGIAEERHESYTPPIAMGRCQEAMHRPSSRTQFENCG